MTASEAYRGFKSHLIQLQLMPIEWIRENNKPDCEFQKTMDYILTMLIEKKEEENKE